MFFKPDFLSKSFVKFLKLFSRMKWNEKKILTIMFRLRMILHSQNDIESKRRIVLIVVLQMFRNIQSMKHQNICVWKWFIKSLSIATLVWFVITITMYKINLILLMNKTVTTNGEEISLANWLLLWLLHG